MSENERVTRERELRGGEENGGGVDEVTDVSHNILQTRLVLFDHYRQHATVSFDVLIT